MKKNKNGVVLWRGLSLIDGEPIVFILTGLKTPSSNLKTGLMYQTWILKEDMHPQQALDSGKDISVCGNCKLKKINGKRICYVNPITLSQVYGQFIKNAYLESPIDNIPSLTLGVRLGSYGDPAAVPLDFLEKLVSKCPYFTGYTQLWRKSFFQGYKSLLVASCLSEKEQVKASSMGWKTFRIKKPNENLLKGEIICPASVKSDSVFLNASCQTCRKCSPLFNSPNIVVDVHGNSAKYFN